ncbi:hypothetical protein Q4Q39_07495 [Flavivirga amylovorans]|uniref:NlpE C-terminal OB domain-containing protein n=1 Tax=Flavivirga amylovorans TaxID=870486 RepID=A0ABT8X0Y2_9FLAO|nr:hypothetical protein [Flavivirga amylovorans]MDO5987235.1 hypothetical protein [Flavivirga amylovorans]
MKKAFFIAILLAVFISCEKGEIIKGEFVYYDGAAVLQTQDEIYGVLVTDKMHELNKKAEAFKSEPTDMVPVEIRGRITNKKDEKILWENKVEIVEILNVTAPKKEDNNVVKLVK